jgi:hypothetical protein
LEQVIEEAVGLKKKETIMFLGDDFYLQKIKEI